MGAGIELVDENDPAVTPRFLAIEASSMGEATRIINNPCGQSSSSPFCAAHTTTSCFESTPSFT